MEITENQSMRTFDLGVIGSFCLFRRPTRPSGLRPRPRFPAKSGGARDVDRIFPVATWERIAISAAPSRTKSGALCDPPPRKASDDLQITVITPT
jgi:hypothetical protein